MDGFLVENIDGKEVCLKGVGKLFYQDGFPISMSIQTLKNAGVEVSILHVADECLKHGWSAKTTFNKIKADFDEDINNEKVNFDELEKFCFAPYEEQRGMIFNSLFGYNKDNAMTFLKDKITKHMSNA